MKYFLSFTHIPHNDLRKLELKHEIKTIYIIKHIHTYTRARAQSHT